MTLIFKNNKWLLWVLIIPLAISVGGHYFINILSPQLDEMRGLKETNQIKKEEILFLENKIHRLSQMQADLEELNLEIKALKNKIPRYQNTITIMVELLKVMDARGFKDTQITMGQAIKDDSESKTYMILPITLNYTATYASAVKLLEEMSRSYHTVKIDLFALDNKIQEERNDGDKPTSGEYVRAQMCLSLYYIEGEEQEEYPNFMEFLNINSNVFLRDNKEELVEAN